MTKTFLKGALLAVVAVSATPALANPATFKAKAFIQKPLTITKKNDLDFGTITMKAALVSDTVTVDKTSTAVAVCGTDLSCSGTSKAAYFTIAGVGNQDVTLDYGVAPTTLSNTDPLVGGTVAFAIDAPTAATLASGVGEFYVGGQITVTSTTKPGSYEAPITVTATYQ